MVGGATIPTNQQPQGSQLPPPPSSSSAVMTEEEEFLKRNTDCVYFLASPLTCKKGSECEYRHSDIARINPRDCWYWLNGNCLNPKCGFRHPPLDGLLGAEVPAPVGPAVTQASVKQGVACIFFQKGFCLKGHLCPFLHGPPNIVNNIPVPSHPVSKPSKLASAGPEKPVHEQKEDVQKPTEFPPQRKQEPRVQPRNGGGGGVEKKVVLPPDEYVPVSVAPPLVMSEFPPTRSNYGVHETNHVSDNEGINGKDVDEYSREPTPGFDVLVDNEVEDSEYYPTEEQFSMGRPVDYDVDRDMYNDQRDFDHYSKEGYGWVDSREASDFGRKRYPREESPDQFDRSDLRHRISKQRRGNNGGGLRSVISREREHPRDNYTDRIPRRDHHHPHHHHSRQHDRHLDSGPAPLSSRLQGRIKIPGRYEHGSRVEREIDMGRQQRSRFRERVNLRSNDDFYNERRDYRGYQREFTGPKRLSDIRNQQSEDKMSFEGPKPLSEILKRKRGSVISSVNNDSSQEIKEAQIENMVNPDKEKPTEVGSIDEELEAYDQKEGEYYYEQVEGEDYNFEEGEEEFMEEGDEGGKKESEVCP